MGLSKIVKKVAKAAVKTVPVAAKLTPAGRVASLAQKAVSLGKRVAQVGVSTTPSIAQAVQQALGVRKRKRRKGIGISDKEAMELLKLRMFVPRNSITYQLAVMKAFNRRLK